MAANPLVTLIWPTPQRHGFSLIVDGTATATDGGIGILVDHAVLHRPSSHADGPAWELAAPRAAERFAE